LAQVAPSSVQFKFLPGEISPTQAACFMSVNLNIKFVRQGAPGSEPQREIPVEFDGSHTVEELKEQISAQVELPKDHIRLVCAGRVWENNATVNSYSPAKGATVYCLNNPPRQAPSSSQQTLQQANPMADMLGAMPPVSNSGDPFENMMQQTQRQMMQNPEMMQQLMNQPAVQNMLNDPETIRAVMRMNPRLNQLMEQRPEIARLLDDPATLQQSMRMMANPSLMREMTRNADRALGQLDAMPGGHEALLRAHEDYLDPLYNAMAGGDDGSANQELPTYAQQTEGGPNTAALPNPWGPPASAPTAAAPMQPNRTAATPNPMAAPNLAAANPLGAAANPLGAAANPLGANPMAANPFMAMMGQMGQQQQQPAAFPTLPQQGAQPAGFMPGLGGVGAGMGGAAGGNPFQAMMQQMMSDPQQMNQMMQFSAQMRQMMGGGAGADNAFQVPGAAMPGVPAVPLATPAAPAPTASVPAPDAAANAGAGPAPMLAMQRMRFQSQLAQLASMGFTNESVCIQALVRHNGRIDAAIETLLTDPSAST